MAATTTTYPARSRASRRGSDWVERSLAPLDWARTRLLRRLRWLVRPFVRSRELRVATSCSLIMLFALSMTLAAPFWLLAVGPILLGFLYVDAAVSEMDVLSVHDRRVS